MLIQKCLCNQEIFVVAFFFSSFFPSYYFSTKFFNRMHTKLLLSIIVFLTFQRYCCYSQVKSKWESIFFIPIFFSPYFSFIPHIHIHTHTTKASLFSIQFHWIICIIKKFVTKEFNGIQWFHWRHCIADTIQWKIIFLFDEIEKKNVGLIKVPFGAFQSWQQNIWSENKTKTKKWKPFHPSIYFFDAIAFKTIFLFKFNVKTNLTLLTEYIL